MMWEAFHITSAATIQHSSTESHPQTYKYRAVSVS
jgi:hypothetical protein